MEVVVTYDINTTDRDGERRLARVAKVCEGYGLRVQYSVFECRLSSTSLELLVGELLDVINPERDSVAVYRVPGLLAESKMSLGNRPRFEPSGPWIV